jgi:hypothetical protein
MALIIPFFQLSPCTNIIVIADSLQIKYSRRFSSVGGRQRNRGDSREAIICAHVEWPGKGHNTQQGYLNLLCVAVCRKEKGKNCVVLIVREYFLICSLSTGPLINQVFNTKLYIQISYSG